MRTEDFEFDIGASAMPTDPAELRGRGRADGRMVALYRSESTIGHAMFPDICNYLRQGDLLVLNDSYMLSNTLRFLAEGAAVQVIVYGCEPDGSIMVEVRPREHAAVGVTLRSADDDALAVTLLAPYPDHIWKASVQPAERLVPTLDAFGTRSDETIPLDPARWRDAPMAYRSVYASKPGSLEIPSAGLHFSTELLDRLVDQGVELAYVTLHVGATEVLAVRHIAAEEIEHHTVREERFDVSAQAAAQINRAKAERRRVVAVGTTVVRTLESVATANGAAGAIQPRSGWTGLYIHPGFDFKVVDALLTNLHRPRSSHIVLTAAFAGTELVMRSYREIIAMGGYELDMFGDSMLIV
jgi:S-adenosylmethionine:tRNA ribosyltransferase-isomerase